MMRHRALAGALATLLVLSACGDDDDGDQAANSTTTAEATTTSAGEALCAAIDNAEQDIGALGDIEAAELFCDRCSVLEPYLMDVLLLFDIAPPRRWLVGEAFGDRSGREPCSPMVDGADTARITQIT